MRLGIVGGSGLYQMAAVEDAELVEIETPWGKPSDSLLLGRIGDTPVAFLPRHGRGNSLTPTELNYRANIAALKMVRSEEYTSELQSLMRTSYDVFCLKKTTTRYSSSTQL